MGEGVGRGFGRAPGLASGVWNDGEVHGRLSIEEILLELDRNTI